MSFHFSRAAFRRVTLLVMIWPSLASFGADVPSTPEILDHQSIADFDRELPPDDGSYPDACFTLRLAAIRPLPKSPEAGDVYIQLRRKAANWVANLHSAATDYNQRSQNSVVIDRLEWDGKSLTGSLKVSIGPDAPRPRSPGFPNPADEFAIDLAVRRKAGEFLPWQPDPLAFMPPWRKDIPSYGGELLRGDYTATRAGQTTKGSVSGAVQPMETAERFGTQGNIIITSAKGGGMVVLARLSPQRVAPPAHAFATRRFATERDWSDWDGVRITVSADRRRDDAAVAVSIHGPNGASSQMTSAALLRTGNATYTIPLAAFAVDRRHINGFAIGVDNSHGVGDVSFVVHQIELVRWKHPPEPSQPLPSRITIDPRTVVSFGGVDEVPKGLFGFHDVGESSPRKPVKDEPDAEEYLRQLRPGFLRPLSHVGFSAPPLSLEQARQILDDRKPIADSVFAKRARAAEALDNVVWTHTTDLWDRPGWMDAGLEKSADGVRAFYRKLATDAYKPGDDNNSLRACEVWNEPFMWARHINMGKLNPPGRKAWTDPTQYGFMPAQVAGDAWATLFLAAVDGAKSVNKDLRLGGPSAIEFSADDFGMFESYLRPILDRCHDKLDFLTEHHYGGDPRSYVAGYEVVTAWCDVRYNRRLPVYVTEANNLGANSAGRASYNIEDILSCIRTCPDKIRGRALHALWNGYLTDEGERHAYSLLSALRGKILATDCSDADLSIVAAAPGNGQVVIVAHNRAWQPKPIELAGLDDFTPVECLSLNGDSARSAPEIKDTEGLPVPPPPPGKTTLTRLPAATARRLNLPARSAVRWTFARRDYAPAGVRRIEQHFADVLLATVKPGVSTKGAVVWHGAMPKEIRSAFLRVVTKDVPPGLGVVLINGHPLPLGPSSVGDGRVVVQDLPFDPSFLAPESQLEFRCTDPERSNGYRVFAASVCIELQPR